MEIGNFREVQVYEKGEGLITDHCVNGLLELAQRAIPAIDEVKTAKKSQFLRMTRTRSQHLVRHWKDDVNRQCNQIHCPMCPRRLITLFCTF